MIDFFYIEVFIMKEHIYSIPLTEALEKKDGCILCTLEKDLEKAAVEYFLGPSMMEPDSRIITNEKGFCPAHMKMLFDGNNRLSLALMLETHIKELADGLCATKSQGFFKKDTVGERIERRVHSCALCDKLSAQMSAAGRNLAYLWASNDDFKKMFESAPPLCLRHTALALTGGEEELSGKKKNEYSALLLKMQGTALTGIYENLHNFTLSFDYRNAGKELTKEEKESVANAIEHLK